MKKNCSIDLLIKNEISYLPLLLENVSLVAKFSKFGDEQVKELKLATEEAFLSIMENALHKESDSINITLNQLDFGIEIILREKGIPYDLEAQDIYSPELFKKTLSLSGIGIFIIKNIVDKASFYNLGRDGREIRLQKYTNSLNINNESENLLEKNVKKKHPDISNVEFKIREMKDTDALDISRCAYYSYGYSYLYDHIYYPERIIKLHENNQFISYVAVLDGVKENRVMGHAALIKKKDYTELGVAFVSPEYRGVGCLKLLTEKLLDRARNESMESIFIFSVTSHEFSQKACSKFNFRDCALKLGCIPMLKFNEIDDGNKNRESLILSMLNIGIESVGNAYVSERYKAIVKKIYNQFGIEIKFDGSSLKIEDNQQESHIRVETEKNDISNIYIKKYGKNIIKRIEKLLIKLTRAKVKSIYVHVNIFVDGASYLMDGLNDVGFVFSGIMPKNSNEHYMILQFVDTDLIDLNNLKINSEVGREIYHLILEDYKVFDNDIDI